MKFLHICINVSLFYIFSKLICYESLQSYGETELFESLGWGEERYQFLTVVFYSKQTICKSLEVGADRKSPTSGELLRATLIINLAALHGIPAIVFICISSSVYGKVKKLLVRTEFWRWRMHRLG